MQAHQQQQTLLQIVREKNKRMNGVCLFEIKHLQSVNVKSDAVIFVHCEMIHSKADVFALLYFHASVNGQIRLARLRGVRPS